MFVCDMSWPLVLCICILKSYQFNDWNPSKKVNEFFKYLDNVWRMFCTHLIAFIITSNVNAHTRKTCLNDIVSQYRTNRISVFNFNAAGHIHLSSLISSPLLTAGVYLMPVAAVLYVRSHVYVIVACSYLCSWLFHSCSLGFALHFVASQSYTHA